jgi:hypothetical protein
MAECWIRRKAVMFKCDKCGLCCMNVGISSIYEGLDRGDGICKHFDDITGLCCIYENRPLLCNVDETYNMYFKNQMTREEYYKRNYEVCKNLKIMKRRE